MNRRFGPRTSALAVAFALISLASANHVLAQSTTGRISGTVTDTSGAILPGVTVTAIEERTGYSKSTVSDERGAYVLVTLPNGTYSVTSELQGFKKEIKS